MVDGGAGRKRYLETYGPVDQFPGICPLMGDPGARKAGRGYPWLRKCLFSEGYFNGEKMFLDGTGPIPKDLQVPALFRFL